MKGSMAFRSRASIFDATEVVAIVSSFPGGIALLNSLMNSVKCPLSLSDGVILGPQAMSPFRQGYSRSISSPSKT